MSGFALAEALATWEAIDAEVRAELARAHDLHGGQHLPADMGPESAPLLGMLFDGWTLSATQLRDAAQQACQKSTGTGTVSWRSVLLEEVFEFLAENPDIDPDAWRTEGVQVICTVIRAMTDQRTSEGDRA